MDCALDSSPKATLASPPASLGPCVPLMARLRLPEPAASWLRLASCGKAAADVETLKLPRLSMSLFRA